VERTLLDKCVEESAVNTHVVVDPIALSGASMLPLASRVVAAGCRLLSM
jgi:hypothetical protein